MSYRANRWPKILAGTIAIGLLVAVVGAPFSHPAKERYFNYVSGSCDEAHELGGIPWQEVLTFDVEVEVFVARDEKELATLACIDRWAGLIMSHHVSHDVAHPTIQLEIRGAHYAPPERLISYHLTRPAD